MKGDSAHRDIIYYIGILYSPKRRNDFVNGCSPVEHEGSISNSHGMSGDNGGDSDFSGFTYGSFCHVHSSELGHVKKVKINK